MKILETPVVRLAAPFLLLNGVPVSAQQLDDTWTVTVEGRSVPVSSEGTFRILNINAPDVVGPDGSAGADGIADDFVRVIATRTLDGGIEYAFSDPFRIVQGFTSVVQDLTFASTPPLLPVALELELDDDLLVAIGQATQARVTAHLPDGGAVDATPASAWTSYRSSNEAVATVDENGVVTARGSGVAYVAAQNEGVTAIERLIVSPGVASTTVVGFVFAPDGSPVEDATAEVVGLGFVGTSTADGSFLIPDVPSGLGPLSVSLQGAIGPDIGTALLGPVAPVPGGLTDAGLGVLGISTAPPVLYVNDNLSTGSAVVALAVGQDGSLEPLPGSPFPTGGAGQPGSFDKLEVFNDRFLYVLNGNSADVSAFAIEEDGSLTPVPGSPFAVGGAPPDQSYSIETTTKGYLYVSHVPYSGTPSVLVHRIESDGSLVFAASVPGFYGQELLTNHAGTLLFAFFGGELTAAAIEPDGLLSPVPSGHGVALEGLSLAVSPDDSRLFASSRTVSPEGLFDATLHAFEILPGGALVSLGEPFFPAHEPSSTPIPRELVVTPDGRTLYLSTRVQSSLDYVSAVAVDPTGALADVPGSPYPTDGTASNKSLVISRDGTLLYEVDEAGTITRFSVQPDGTLVPDGVVFQLTGFTHAGAVLLK